MTDFARLYLRCAPEKSGITVRIQMECFGRWWTTARQLQVNHRCETIEEPMREVVHYLMKHNRRVFKSGVSES